MEVPFDLEEFFEDAPIQRLDLNTLRRLNPRKCWPVQKAIDRMGALSAEAQGLKRVLTSYDKLIDSDDGQVLYLMWKKDPNHEKSSIVIGILKIGYKCLYLMDASMKTFKTTPLCILDFYVHDTLQRRGNGHALFEYMIQHEGSSVEKVAIDKPSDSLLQFMNKYYALTNPLWQSTNYVVYAPFFDFLRPSDEVDDNRKQLVSSKTEALMQNEKQKPQRARMHDSVAGIMYGGSSIPKRVLAAPDTPQGRKNARDFGHQTICWYCIVLVKDGAAKTAAMDWSPNGAKLAFATADRAIVLFDAKGQRRDKFSTKPIDPKYGKKSYVVNSIVFSPDSTRLAVGQTDHIVYVYRLGESWDEKKVICNKFAQSSAVTSMVWPSDERLVVGLADGKVRLASCKYNKCSTLYRTDIFVASIALQPSGRSFVSGHSDGSVILFSFENRSQNKIFTHHCPPYALVFTSNGIVAAGCDQRVVSYTESGRVLQQFDYSSEQNEKEFTTAIRDPSGQNIVIGSFDRVRLFTWNQRRGALEEGKPLEIRYLYTVSALTWSPDGSTIAVGTLCGGVITVDCCLRRSLLKGRFETTYVAPSQVLIKDISSEQRITIRSSKGYSIEEIKVMGRDRFVVAYTPNSLIVADMATDRSSEVTWQSAGNERFFFDNENVCLIVNAGEVSLVEYGTDEVIGWIRTELISPHLLSVRISERKQKNKESVKRIAYLLDVNTISIVDLVRNTQFTQISHPVVIDWLELSETATKLLFRDRRLRLSLVDLDSDRKTTTLLSYCTYVQWVPNSDVIVAQSGDQLCVWYQADSPDQMVMVPIKGDIETVLRDESRTEVIVEEANAKVAYELDQTLIEFATALDNLEFGRAVDFLERRDDGDVDGLWRQLAQVALEQQQLLIAQRCYAALGDLSRVKMLADTIQIAETAAKTIGGDGKQYYKVRARLALMRKDFKEAERIYLEQNCLDEAIEMYQNIYKWEEALELARARNYPDFESLKARYYRNLFDSGQDEKAAEISEREGDLQTAIDLYLKANLGVHAARVLLSSPELLANEDLVQKVAITLVRSELFEKAGDLFEKTKDFERALECFRKGKCFAKAIQLARISFPERVVALEEEWGDSLVESASYDAAINHFLESGKSAKALEASIKAKQWSKAAQIADVLQDSALAKQYYGRIAEHHAAIGDLERAEMLYIEADMQREAINMYNKANRWADSHRLAAEFLGQEETQKMYGKLAQDMEEAGRFSDAEQLYISIGQPNKAIAMYKKADRLEEMMALVEKYHSEHVQETHKHIAGDLEERGDLKAAEEQYLKAGDWKSAVNMYRAAEEWNDAYRIAKQEGGEAAQKQVAYLWAKSLGGDSAVKLLQKFNLLDESIDFACENGAFDFAFELCRLGAKARLPFVHVMLAQQLEEEGQFENAEKHYIEGGKPKEAVLMEHCEEALSDVFVGQARVAIEQKDFPRAESYLLRANRADIILRYYKESAMWPDALRIAKDYLPTVLPQLQEEFEEAQLKSGAKGALSFMAQGRDWETQGEYLRAVQCYMKVQEPETTDISMIVTALTRAGDLATKFLSEDENGEIIDAVCERLIEYKRFNEAAEVFIAANRPESAIKAFVLAGQWAKAKKNALVDCYSPDRFSSRNLLLCLPYMRFCIRGDRF
ncbi:unnamed protein product [Toxocara canis]|uniref:Alpha-tubulin N-acetyltransferase n=1 Tax=Toxocara canis TaxID=6265 RepID=A0A183UCL1_TOXCA|nr:unnamed protein product [Toxocara canis]